MYKQGTFSQGNKRVKITPEMIETGNLPDSLLVDSAGTSGCDDIEDDIGDDEIDEDEDANE